jgi:rhomboid domain-containing protein 1
MYNFGTDWLNFPARALYHASWTHLLANGISFLGLSFLESYMGSGKYFLTILFIWIVSTIILWIIQKLFPSRKRLTVGFSGVIFGLVVVYIVAMAEKVGLSLFGLALSIIPQLFIPGISFEGHLSGIIAGIIYVVIFPPKKMDAAALKAASNGSIFNMFKNFGNA